MTIVPLRAFLRDPLSAGADAGPDDALAETETFELSAATLAASAGISIAPQKSATPKTHISVTLQRNEMVSDVVIIVLAFQMSKFINPTSLYTFIKAFIVPNFSKNLCVCVKMTKIRLFMLFIYGFSCNFIYGFLAIFWKGFLDINFRVKLHTFAW